MKTKAQPCARVDVSPPLSEVHGAAGSAVYPRALIFCAAPSFNFGRPDRGPYPFNQLKKCLKSLSHGLSNEITQNLERVVGEETLDWSSRRGCTDGIVLDPLAAASCINNAHEAFCDSYCPQALSYSRVQSHRYTQRCC